ncbi:MAG: SH3 domain-containing protein [Pyrinomonadaceae bacterium]
MKKCPQCSTVYGDETVYCLNDGAALIEETFSMPSTADDSFEAETVIRHEPIIIDVGANPEIPPTANYQTPTLPENIIVVPAKTSSNAGKYALFLVLGLLIGGGLVLATLLLSRGIYKGENADSVKTNQTEKLIKTSSTTEINAENKNENKAVEIVSGKHDKTTAASDADFNGRVIAANARVRSAPDADSSTIDTLPMNDRLNIIRRENPNSPWYEVECEHGTSGWMHGNTIEFTR